MTARADPIQRPETDQPIPGSHIKDRRAWLHPGPAENLITPRIQEL